jgi:hypothetical protein
MWNSQKSQGPYQESREPVEEQECGFLPKKSDSSARNVLEHCRGGGANFLLTTSPVCCTAFDFLQIVFLASTFNYLFISMHVSLYFMTGQRSQCKRCLVSADPGWEGAALQHSGCFISYVQYKYVQYKYYMHYIA